LKDFNILGHWIAGIAVIHMMLANEGIAFLHYFEFSAIEKRGQEFVAYIHIMLLK
jgi:hypothetical protein